MICVPLLVSLKNLLTHALSLIQSFSSRGKSGVGGSENHILVIIIIISVGAFTIIVVVVGAFLCTRRTTSHQKK